MGHLRSNVILEWNISPTFQRQSDVGVGQLHYFPFCEGADHLFSETHVAILFRRKARGTRKWDMQHGRMQYTESYSWDNDRVKQWKMYPSNISNT